MIELNVKDYYKALKPLEELEFNTLFAKTVIIQKIPSSIYVDNEDNPTVFYIAHPYGMSLLFGNYRNEKYNNLLKDYILNKNNVRSRREWLQFYPNDWAYILDALLGDDIFMNLADLSMLKEDDSSKVIKSTRLNFEFNKDNYLKLKNSRKTSERKIVITDEKMFDRIDGSVIPKDFWNDGEQFVKYGRGYSIIIDNEIASTAFASFVDVGKLELGIETTKKYRGMGCATDVCIALIDYCLEKGLEPIWSCNNTNTGSENLAKKLGFERSLTLPYYRLIY